MKKTVVLLACAGMFGSLVSWNQTTVNAENNQEMTSEMPEANKENRTLIITAKGKITGSMVPYYEKNDIPNFKTGYLDFHYESHNMGFVDGDNSYLTIELPSEFATIAKQEAFKRNISGRVQRKGILGDRWFEYRQSDIVVHGTQITFKVPRELWIGHGEVISDVTINYGAVQREFPIRLIPNNYNGYVFTAALRRSMAPWDPIQNPILGSNSSKWESSYTSAYM
ncbi:hypothetical protein UAW_02488 [Enterococcus haemoperoxidus ATCC BAA-382]|uniref:WxL domain-containing protein n=1 Tax=Enterococcus haemoperoxidus ATCC BAA-382 TaxID=1158608 RepID=R2QE83_9ENTE|nr:hypothetical protein [Enterococcus haemoperoxidus]EOH93538.1 hypothetical protein UAW_02488 [Enterococcus haemoperoxidus ATCC BAA-382]EOT63373.1 hypothetical protein I583_00173 [Enterococcus haemoperoxidus ATCC BAA-382]OJG50747.1 hypothetical protein RV06_GL001666 [Enterococcus haemoperoxidus]